MEQNKAKHFYTVTTFLWRVTDYYGNGEPQGDVAFKVCKDIADAEKEFNRQHNELSPSFGELHETMMFMSDNLSEDFPFFFEDCESDEELLDRLNDNPDKSVLYYSEVPEFSNPLVKEYDEYKNIEGALLLNWSWDRYIGYSRNFHSIRYASADETTERDILSNNEESTNKIVTCVLLYKDEMENLTDTELKDKIIDELTTYFDKWNCSYEFMELWVSRFLGLEEED